MAHEHGHGHGHEDHREHSPSDFDDKADTWDDDPAHEARQIAVAAAIAATLALTPETRALDIGGGTGRLSILLANRVGSIIVTDPSAGMVAVANQRIAEAGFADKMRAEQVDLTADEFAGEHDVAAFDVAWSSLAFHHVPDLDKLLRTIAALLTPGGQLAIADLERDPDGAFHAHKPGFDGHHGFDRDALAQQLRAAGFEQVTFTDATTIEKEGREFGVFLCTATKTPA